MLRSRSQVLLVIAIASAVPAAARAAGENWPQWRGPGGQGVSTELQLPTEWGSDKNIAWKTLLPGSGHSSPIVWGDRLSLTSAFEGSSVAGDRKHTLKVMPLDTKSGKLLWEQTAFEGAVFDARHERSSFAPTAATDGQMVFAYFGPEGLYAYDFSGKLVWKSVVKFPTLGLGTGTSPVLFQDLVIIQRDEDEGRNSAIVAYDKRTGKEIWKTKRAIQISWGTPALVTTSGSRGNIRRVPTLHYAPCTCTALEDRLHSELNSSRALRGQNAPERR